uniref:Uncharacterized protein n=1 Tax=Ditylum brightwellii TaxID=49249 RepID=A0A7S4R6L4_9STRA
MIDRGDKAMSSASTTSLARHRRRDRVSGGAVLDGKGGGFGAASSQQLPTTVKAFAEDKKESSPEFPRRSSFKQQQQQSNLSHAPSNLARQEPQTGQSSAAHTPQQPNNKSPQRESSRETLRGKINRQKRWSQYQQQKQSPARKNTRNSQSQHFDSGHEHSPQQPQQHDQHTSMSLAIIPQPNNSSAYIHSTALHHDPQNNVPSQLVLAQSATDPSSLGLSTHPSMCSTVATNTSKTPVNHLDQPFHHQPQNQDTYRNYSHYPSLQQQHHQTEWQVKESEGSFLDDETAFDSVMTPLLEESASGAGAGAATSGGNALGGLFKHKVKLHKRSGSTGSGTSKGLMSNTKAYMRQLVEPQKKQHEVGTTNNSDGTLPNQAQQPTFDMSTSPRNTLSPIQSAISRITARSSHSLMQSSSSYESMKDESIILCNSKQHTTSAKSVGAGAVENNTAECSVSDDSGTSTKITYGTSTSVKSKEEVSIPPSSSGNLSGGGGGMNILNTSCSRISENLSMVSGGGNNVCPTPNGTNHHHPIHANNMDHSYNSNRHVAPPNPSSYRQYNSFAPNSSYDNNGAIRDGVPSVRHRHRGTTDTNNNGIMRMERPFDGFKRKRQEWQQQHQRGWVRESDDEGHGSNCSTPNVTAAVGLTAVAAAGGVVLGPMGILVGVALVGLGFSLSQIPEDQSNDIRNYATHLLQSAHEKAVFMHETVQSSCVHACDSSGLPEQYPVIRTMYPKNGDQGVGAGADNGGGERESTQDVRGRGGGMVGDNNIGAGSRPNSNAGGSSISSPYNYNNAHTRPFNEGHVVVSRNTDNSVMEQHHFGPGVVSQMHHGFDVAEESSIIEMVACLKKVWITPVSQIYSLEPSHQPRAWFEVIASALTSVEDKNEAMEEILIFAKDKLHAKLFLQVSSFYALCFEIYLECCFMYFSDFLMF